SGDTMMESVYTLPGMLGRITTIAIKGIVAGGATGDQYGFVASGFGSVSVSGQARTIPAKGQTTNLTVDGSDKIHTVQPSRSTKEVKFSSGMTEIFVESLEARIAPAVLVNPKTVTYQDVDGDTVTVKISKGTLDLNLFDFTAGSGSSEILDSLTLTDAQFY